ncbi:MAG: hypothetical protein KDB03_07480 [Planctomycetales bacterium]|nr:hypothetical protein [Planctomycetales bacterium]
MRQLILFVAGLLCFPAAVLAQHGHGGHGHSGSHGFSGGYTGGHSHSNYGGRGGVSIGIGLGSALGGYGLGYGSLGYGSYSGLGYSGYRGPSYGMYGSGISLSIGPSYYGSSRLYSNYYSVPATGAYLYNPPVVYTAPTTAYSYAAPTAVVVPQSNVVPNTNYSVARPTVGNTAGELRPGMVLEDGATVISVQPIGSTPSPTGSAAPSSTRQF